MTSLPSLPFSLPSPREIFQTFMRHGTSKQLSSSVRKPGRSSGKLEPTCTPEQAASYSRLSRNQQRHYGFLAEMSNVNKMAGGEPRKIRRAMARDRAKLVRKQFLGSRGVSRGEVVGQRPDDTL